MLVYRVSLRSAANVEILAARLALGFVAAIDFVINFTTSCRWARDAVSAFENLDQKQKRKIVKTTQTSILSLLLQSPS